jgi:hypothetical protein
VDVPPDPVWGHYANEVSDVTLMNWPQMDYWLTPLVAVTDAERTASLAKARELTLCFVQWLQIDAPGPDGGTGYPGLRLCPDASALKTVWRLQRPRQVRNSPALLADFQKLLISMGVQLYWPADIQTKVR